MASRYQVFLTVLLLAAAACAADWPRFRGPNGSGVAEARNLPTEFSASKNVRWRTALPVGHSSPVLVGNRVIVTAFEKDKLLTIALDRDSGKILWRGEVTRARSDRLHDNNNPAAPSVAADRENVYSFFADFGLASYTLDGKERWRVPLGPFRSYHGMGSSPILAGRTLLLNCDQDVGSFLVAIDTVNGSVRWRKDRADKPGNGFSTPVLNEAGDEVMVLGPTQLTAYSVADGSKLWWVGGLPRQPKGSPVLAKDAEGRPLVILSVQTVGDENSNIARMPPWQVVFPMLDTNKDGKVTKEDLVGQLAGFIEPFMQADANGDGELTEDEWKMYTLLAPNALLGIRPEGRGDLTSKVLWRQVKGIPNVPSPLVYQNVLYVIKEGGVLTSLNPATGEVLKQARVTGAVDPYFASPVAADGKVYLTTQSGRIAVLKAGAQWEILQVNSMDEEIFATPALADGRIYVRTRAALYCVETPRQQP